MSILYFAILHQLTEQPQSTLDEVIGYDSNATNSASLILEFA
jgi:hypothetical protein